VHWSQFEETGQSFDFWLKDWRRTFRDEDYYVDRKWGKESRITLREAADVIAMPLRLFFR
jgi:hypothetical protein